MNINKIDLWDWDKKKRTMLRSIDIGDIVCFEITESKQKYSYGILIAKALD